MFQICIERTRKNKPGRPSPFKNHTNEKSDAPTIDDSGVNFKETLRMFQYTDNADEKNASVKSSSSMPTIEVSENVESKSDLSDDGKKKATNTFPNSKKRQTGSTKPSLTLKVPQSSLKKRASENDGSRLALVKKPTPNRRKSTPNLNGTSEKSVPLLKSSKSFSKARVASTQKRHSIAVDAISASNLGQSLNMRQLPKDDTPDLLNDCPEYDDSLSSSMLSVSSTSEVDSVLEDMDWQLEASTPDIFQVINHGVECQKGPEK